MSKLDIYEFGKQLLETRDLDPVYVVLHEAKLERPKLLRWLLSYWCYYHSGTASWIVDGVTDVDYWVRMSTAAESKDYPRCHERRHFRGENARKSIAFLRQYKVESLFQPLIGVDAPVSEVMDYVKTWVGFGKWIAFKVADMLERLGLARVNFYSGEKYFFDSPKKVAVALWEYNKRPLTSNVIAWAVDDILARLSNHKAPPRYDRYVNMQEAETILCKYHSYTNGKYTIGEDVDGTKRGLLRFARCGTSQTLIQAGMRANLW